MEEIGLLNKEYKYGALYTFLLLFIGTSIALFIDNMVFPYYDSWWYWHIADPIKMPDGSYDFFQFPSTFRGYFFPFFMFIIKNISVSLFGNEFYLYRLVISFCAPFLFVYELPIIFKKRVATGFNLIRITIAYIVFAFIFFDWIKYPLSDLFALFFFTSALYVFNLECKRIYSKILQGFFISFFFYIAYNTRVVFLVPCLIAVLVYVVYIIRIKHFDKVLILASLLGFIAVATPQSLLNAHYSGTYTPRVLTENYEKGDGSKLEWYHVYKGLKEIGIDGFVGDPKLYPTVGVFFIDQSAVEIIKREKLDLNNFDLKTYLSLWLKYPMDLTAIYFKHLIFVMTPKYSDLVYVFNLNNDKSLLILFSIAIWLIGGGKAIFDVQKHNVSLRSFIYFGVITLSYFLQLPAHGETRYFLGMYVLCYFFVFYHYDYRRSGFITAIKEHKVLVSCVVTVISLLWISLISEILTNNEHMIFLINDYLVD